MKRKLALRPQQRSLTSQPAAQAKKAGHELDLQRGANERMEQEHRAQSERLRQETMQMIVTRHLRPTGVWPSSLPCTNGGRPTPLLRLNGGKH